MERFFLFTSLAFIGAYLAFGLTPVTPGHHTLDNKFSARYVEAELTKHQWTLAEIVQAKGDSSVNLTLFMLPCEKDNLLKYEVNGTYQITEGEKVCAGSPDKVKGTGTWEYEEADRAIIDSYMGGRRIEKKIIEINPEMFKVQYETEGRTITTLTYFSEKGLENDALVTDMVTDNSNQAKNVAAASREALVQAARYVVVGRRDFERGQSLKFEDKGGLMKKVIVYPFMNSTDANETVQENERLQGLIAQGKKVGLDYIVTGNIIKTDSDVDEAGKHLGHVKYSVSVLDVKNGEEKIRKVFEYSERAEKEKREKNNRALGQVVGVLAATSAMRSSYYYNGYYNRYRYGWDDYYTAYFMVNAASMMDVGLDRAFTPGLQRERDQHYKKSIAIMEAIAHTTGDVADFVVENLPLIIKINDVERNNKGKMIGLTIEAGSNVNLQEKEILEAVRIQQIELSDGTVTEKVAPIAKLEVQNVNSRLSTVKIKNLMEVRKLETALQENGKEVFVRTTKLPKTNK